MWLSGDPVALADNDDEDELTDEQRERNAELDLWEMLNDR